MATLHAPTQQPKNSPLILRTCLCSAAMHHHHRQQDMSDIATSQSPHHSVVLQTKLKTSLRHILISWKLTPPTTATKGSGRCHVRSGSGSGSTDNYVQKGIKKSGSKNESEPADRGSSDGSAVCSPMTKLAHQQ